MTSMLKVLAGFIFIFQIDAPFKCIATYIGNSVGDGNTRQVFATSEGTVTNACNTVGDRACLASYNELVGVF